MTGPIGPFQEVVPGMYLDRDDNVVFNVADILLAMGMEDNPENRRQVGLELADRFSLFTTTPVIFRPPGDSRWREYPDE